MTYNVQNMFIWDITNFKTLYFQKEAPNQYNLYIEINVLYTVKPSVSGHPWA